MNVKLISVTEGVNKESAEDIIVYAARVSSPRKDKLEAPDGLLNYCINNKHWSVFETASATVEIKTSRAIGRQLLRHQAKFQEFSQRYAEVVEFEPIELRLQAVTNRQSSTEVIHDAELEREIEEHLYNSKRLYTKMLNRNIAKECARMILPETSSTTMYMTNNLRNWIHFLDVRNDTHSQKEIQDVAKEIQKELKNKFPLIGKTLNW